MEPVYWQDTQKLLGYIEKVDKTWFSYTLLEKYNEHSDTAEACHTRKADAISEVKREFQKRHGKLRAKTKHTNQNILSLKKIGL